MEAPLAELALSFLCGTLRHQVAGNSDEESCDSAEEGAELGENGAHRSDAVFGFGDLFDAVRCN